MRTFVRLVAAGCVLHVVTGVGLPVSAAASQQDREPGRCHEVRDVGSLSGFGVELLRAVSGKGRENVLVSPLGIGAVLAMLAPGAKEPVRESIREMLGAGSDDTESTGTGAAETTLAAGEPAGGAASAGHTRDRDMVRRLGCQLQRVSISAEGDDKVDVQVANGAFVDPRLALFPGFASVLRDRFHARVERLDFSDVGSVGRINSWVASATRNAIPQLVSSLEPDEALMLVNAVSFRGEWRRRFDPERTAPAPFHLGSGASVEVPAMRADMTAEYRENSSFQAVALPYGGRDFWFVVVLPRPGVAAPDALREMDPSWFRREDFSPHVEGSLTLPRMTLNEDVSLLPVLHKLGLESVLKDKQAFAGIAAPPPKLSRVLHRTRLVLDEKGTEAAAATGAMAIPTSLVPDRFDVKVDRPFAFAVVHRGTDTVLFMGWVANPLQG